MTVEHEPDPARFAGRIIVFRDGTIRHDGRVRRRGCGRPDAIDPDMKTSEIISPQLASIDEEPFYRPVRDEDALFAAAYERRLPVLLKGPTGCGKTRFVEYMAWRSEASR